MSRKEAKHKVIEMIGNKDYGPALTLALEYRFPEKWIKRILELINEETQKVIERASKVIGTELDPVVTERERILREMTEEREKNAREYRERELAKPKLKDLLKQKLWAKAYKLSEKYNLKVSDTYMKPSSGYRRYIDSIVV